MFKIFVTIDKHQRFKSFIRQTTSIKLEHSSSNAENSFDGNFKMLTSSSNCGLRSSASQHSIVQILIRNEMNNEANIAGHLSIGPIVNG